MLSGARNVPGTCSGMAAKAQGGGTVHQQKRKRWRTLKLNCRCTKYKMRRRHIMVNAKRSQKCTRYMFRYGGQSSRRRYRASAKTQTLAHFEIKLPMYQVQNAQETHHGEC